jgi:hypothetical protein
LGDLGLDGKVVEWIEHVSEEQYSEKEIRLTIKAGVPYAIAI